MSTDQLLKMLRESWEPMQIPKTYSPEIKQLENAKLIKIMAIEPLYFICEAADVPPIMRCQGNTEVHANLGVTPLKSTPNASAEGTKTARAGQRDTK